MSIKNMSAKDRAFQKERIKFNKEINALCFQIKELKIEKSAYVIKISELEEEIRILKDWNDRLLNYLDMSEDEFKELLESEKTRAEISKSLSNIFLLKEKLGGGLFV